MSELPPVVYLAGLGRSGSTVLGVLLGAAPGALFAGELTWLARDLLEDRPCSCGRAASDCPVWGGVRDHLGTSPEGLAAWAELAARSERHLALPGPPSARWTELQARVLRALAAVTGARVVVDSSKLVARGVRLAHVTEVRALWLRRDPAGLLTSFSTTHDLPEQPPRGRASLAAWHAAILAERRLHGLRALPVRHEALREDPVGTLASVAAHTGLDLSEVTRAVRDRRPLPVGHVLTANRLRRQGTVVLAPSERPAPRGRRDRLTVGAMRAVERVLG